MRTPQRGGGLLIVVLLLITAGSFAVVIAASQSGGDIRDSDHAADSLQALYLAETGIERALKRFATSASATPCASLTAETITDLTGIGLGASSHSIAILDGMTTDFEGNTLPLSQCRVGVTGTVVSSGVSRTLHAIVDRNLLEGTDNPTFDNPLTGTSPTGWTGQTPAAAYAPAGGADGTAPDCRRAAWTARNSAAAAANDRRASATATMAATVASGSTSTIRFHLRHITRTNDCGALPGGGPSAATFTAACGALTGAGYCFQLVGLNTGAAAQTWTFPPQGSLAASANSAQAACPSVFSPCATSYQAGAPTTKVVQTVTMTNAASISSFVYWMQLQGATRREIFIDYIEVTNPTFVGTAQVRRWRDCSTADVPATCL